MVRCSKHRKGLCTGCNNCVVCTHFEVTDKCDPGAHVKKARGRPGKKKLQDDTGEERPLKRRSLRSVPKQDYSGQAESKHSLFDTLRVCFDEALLTCPIKHFQSRIALFGSETLQSKSGKAMAVSFMRHLMKAILCGITEDMECARRLEEAYLSTGHEATDEGQAPEMDITGVLTKFACNTVQKNERRVALSLLCKAHSISEVVYILS